MKPKTVFSVGVLFVLLKPGPLLAGGAGFLPLLDQPGAELLWRVKPGIPLNLLRDAGLFQPPAEWRSAELEGAWKEEKGPSPSGLKVLILPLKVRLIPGVGSQFNFLSGPLTLVPGPNLDRSAGKAWDCQLGSSALTVLAPEKQIPSGPVTLRYYCGSWESLPLGTLHKVAEQGQSPFQAGKVFLELTARKLWTDSLIVPGDSLVKIPAPVGPGKTLEGSLVVIQTSAVDGPPPLAKAEIFLNKEEAPALLWSQSVTAGRGPTPPVLDFKLDLGAYSALAGAGPTTFLFKLSSAEKAGEVFGAWAQPLLRTPGEGGGRTPLILISCDALRADRLGAYGNKRGITPNLDRLAREGAKVFKNAYSASSWTLPAHLSMFTGLYPTFFGNLKNLDPGVPTLGEEFRKAGYLNFAVTGIPWMRPQHGFGRGFHAYKYEPKEGGRPMADVVTDALDWLNKNKDLPFFMFLHACSPHEPYRSAPECLDRLIKNDPASRHQKSADLGSVMQRERAGETVPDDEKRRIEDFYDCNVLQMDEALGRLFDGLKALGLYDKVGLILTGDHGEEFWEHGHHGHGNAFYEETVRVPLLLKVPGAPQPGVDERMASHVDILPTLLALAGAQPSRPLLGKNLLESWDRESVFSEDPMAYHSSVTSRRYKMIRRNKFPDQFYDLKKDPGQKNNIAGKGGDLEEEADSQLSSFLASAYTGWKMKVVPVSPDKPIKIQVSSDGVLIYRNGEPFLPPNMTDKKPNLWAFTVKRHYLQTFIMPLSPPEANIKVSAWIQDGDQGEPKPFPIFVGNPPQAVERPPAILGAKQPGFPGSTLIGPSPEKPGIYIWQRVPRELPRLESPMTEEELQSLRSLGYLH